MIKAVLLLAHLAQGGWMYDAKCCSGRDCARVLPQEVSVTAEGYLVQIAPGGHPFAPLGKTELVPFNDPKINISGDSEYHACLSTQGRLLCLYVPEVYG